MKTHARPRTLVRVSALICLLVLAAVAGAQVQRGSIVGTVYDQHGAVVVGAEVTAIDNATGASFSGKTNEEGTFTIPSLPFGSYSVRITASGFRKWETKNVEVVTAQVANVKATLEIGATSEVVIVEDSQILVDTTSNEISTHISQKQVRDLPSLSRNPFDIAVQQPGVTSTGSATSGSSVMNGLRGSSNNLTQDGIDIRDSFIKTSGFANNSGYDITLESVGEFSISGNNIGADSGDGVVQVRITTARGGNQYHGSGFYQGRNDAFNANTWFNNLRGTPKSRLHNHRFGGSIGGPVTIPKLYNGKDRSFFFFQYSAFREKYQSTDANTVFTDSARQGLFKYVDRNGVTQTVNLLTASTRGLALNPFTQKLIGATPLPVAGGLVSLDPSRGDSLNTTGVRFKVPGADPINQYDMRFDHKVIENSKWGSHWLEADWHWERSSAAPYDDPAFPKGVSPTCFGAVCLPGDNETAKGGLLALAMNSTFGSTISNELRAGFNRPSIAFVPPTAFPRPFKVNFASSITNPEYNFDPQGRLSPFYTVVDNFTKLRGSHTLKAGVLYSTASVHRYNDWGYSVSGGLVPMVVLGSNTSNDDGMRSCPSTVFPNLPTGSAGTTICNRARALYQDLVGLVNNVSQSWNAIPGVGFVPGLSDDIFLRERSYNFYGQDSWRLRSNLTLNLGLRYELVPAVDIVNKRGLVPSQALGDSLAYGALFTPGTKTFNDLKNNLSGTTQLIPGGASNGRPFWNTDMNNFAPSIGVAWEPLPKTVIRAGYSISYVRDTLTVVTNVLSSNPGFRTGKAVSPAAGDAWAVLDPNVSQSQPTPTLNLPIYQYNNFLNGFSSTGASTGMEAIDPNLKTPYVQQWSFGIQRELTPAMALEVRYVGNHSTKMYRGDDLDQIRLTPALLAEYNQAVTNYNLCSQNLLACTGSATGTATFANKGLAGQAALSTLAAINFPNSLYTSSTFTNLVSPGRNEAGQFWWLVQSNCTQRFLTNPSSGSCAGLGTFPANYFIANPFTGSDRVFTNGMDSRYDGLQIELRRRMTHGLQFNANYTFAKVLTNSAISGSQSELDPTLDFTNLTFNRVRAAFDIRHTSHFNAIYEFPVGRGRRFLARGPLGRVLEGWQIGSLWTTHSGPPVTIVSGRGTVNRSGNSGNNPAVPVGLSAQQVCSDMGVYKTAQGVYSLPSSYWVAGSNPGSTLYANSSVLTNPAAGLLGDKTLRNEGCSGAWLNEVDMNFVKKTKLTERVTFEFRAEFFNAFNHPNFSMPTAPNINNAGFGTITSLISPAAREIQFNGRITF